MGICRYGARIGYEGPRNSVNIYPNLSTAEEDEEIVTADIVSELADNRLKCYLNRSCLPTYYKASPLGLVDKSDGTKRRIHHLSYPPEEGGSINYGIPQHYGTIAYSNISEAVPGIQSLGKNSLLKKRDFEKAFRHIPISPLDTPLLEFHWQNKYYAEQFLPFGLRTAPYIFNLFAETFHWILEKLLENNSLPAVVVHYLDDFLIVLPEKQDLIQYSSIFSRLCSELRLSLKISKNEEGNMASFGGIEFDTERMVIRLPAKKLQKVKSIVDKAQNAQSASLIELQRVTGFLNFASIVIPLGRTFLR